MRAFEYSRRGTWLRNTLVATLLSLCSAMACASGESARCDKACLESMMDGYLRQLLAHDAQGLPLAPSVVARENAEPVAIGTGTAWTALERLLSGFTSADPLSGQVVYFGAAEIAKAPHTLVVRLKVAHRKIVESEIMYMDDGQKDTRKKLFPRDTAGLTQIDDILWFARLPEDRRSSRDRLLAIADAYLDGLSAAHDQGRIPFDPRCERYESGLRMTNSTRVFGDLLPLNGPCVSGINLPPNIVDHVYNRRFFVADPETGIVALSFALQYSDKAPLGLAEDHATLVYEVFKIVDGRIRLIDANTLHRFKPPYQSGFADSDTSAWSKLPGSPHGS
ncbi:hypothetical protein [Pseudomonas sp. zfem002]|uniref:hypothetical protein n=1 Tax=Pseudomonas sp. zfem002 TaxID=3078197 RepID=UPI002929052D|nr:hypothetical protein [Pseudomonas sp. zfem002]MDU9392867.1 hypothetical protein [Pseudomonas sp. zfem002]